MHARQLARPVYRRQSGRDYYDLPAEPRPVVDRLADCLAERMRDGADTDQHDLVRAGFSEAEIITHFDAADAKADAMQVIGIDDDRTAYDREARVNVGANAIAGMLLNDTGAVHVTLVQAGLTTTEIGRLYPDIIGGALKLVRLSRANRGR